MLQQKRWNSRAASWDDEIMNPEHYVNFEEGYQRFLDFEKRELSQLEKQESGIDIGCGTGVTSVILSDKVKNIYLLDIAEKMLVEAKKKLPNAVAINASATDIPLPSDSINVVVSRGIVVSHLPEGMQESFFNELQRIVRKGGKIIIDFLSNTDTADFHNVSPKIAFTIQEMQRILESRGFSRVVFDGENSNRVIRVSAIKQ